MNKQIQVLPPIKEMGLSEATESFIWSIFDDDATARIIAAHINILTFSEVSILNSGFSGAIST